MIDFAIVVQSSWTHVVAICGYIFVVIIQMLANIDLLIQSLRPQMVCGLATATSTHTIHTFLATINPTYIPQNHGRILLSHIACCSLSVYRSFSL